MKTKEDFVKEIIAAGFPENEVVIGIDDFFCNENFMEGCIGVNIYPDPPAPEKFYEVFKELLTSNKADTILVRISDIDDPKEWFYSDTVYVIGSLTLEDLNNAIEILRPDEVDEVINGIHFKIQDLESGQKIYSMWWD